MTNYYFFQKIILSQLVMSQQYFKTWLLSLLLSSLVVAEWNPKDFLKREHSLIKPFTGIMYKHKELF